MDPYDYSSKREIEFYHKEYRSEEKFLKNDEIESLLMTRLCFSLLDQETIQLLSIAILYKNLGKIGSYRAQKNKVFASAQKKDGLEIFLCHLFFWLNEKMGMTLIESNPIKKDSNLELPSFVRLIFEYVMQIDPKLLNQVLNTLLESPQ